MRTVPFTVVLVLAALTALLAPTPSPVAGLVVAAGLLARVLTRYVPTRLTRPVSAPSRVG